MMPGARRKQRIDSLARAPLVYAAYSLSHSPVAIAKVPPLDSPTSASRVLSPPNAHMFFLTHLTAARQSLQIVFGLITVRNDEVTR